MVSSSQLILLLIIFFIYIVSISSSSFVYTSHNQEYEEEEIRSVIGRRNLLSYKEKQRGSNVTFDCSPSGPCVSCSSSEKRKEKYRCSETGYRIPFKCKEVRVEASQKKMKDTKEETQNNQSNANNDNDDEPEEEEVVVASDKPRNLLADDSTPSSKMKKSQSYKTYRSCVPSADEEKLSVLGFEAIMLGMFLISVTAIYVKKKQTVPMLGVSNGRPQSNSRF
ncbi:unnamed protein product [Cochlearia groenlandica]